MNKRAILTYMSIGFALYMLCPGDLSAADVVKDFGGTKIGEQTSAIRQFIFGAPMNTVCMFGGVYGIYRMFMEASAIPLLTWGGGACLVKIIPHFLDGLFG